MRFVIIVSLLSLAAAAPVQEEKRQTDLGVPGSFTGVRPTGSFSRRPHGTGSFVRPTGSFTGTFVRPTGSFTGVRPAGSHTPHGAHAPPVSTAVVERQEAPTVAAPVRGSHTGSHTPHARPTGTGDFVRPSGTGARVRPTGSFTGTFVRPTGAPGTRPSGTRVRPSGGDRVRPTGSFGAAPPAAPTADVEEVEDLDVEDPDVEDVVRL